jgi:ABC-type transport system involved in multi-copper enzyme maturation permease subunit
MRSGLAAGLMGIGWILISFGAVIAVLYVFARQGGDTLSELPAMATGAVASLVVGAVMFVVGYLLSRMGRSSDRRPDGSIA